MLARAQRKTLPGTMPLVPGQAVEALWPEDGEWYNAVVRAVTNKGIELDYEDGDFRADATEDEIRVKEPVEDCLLYTSPSPRDGLLSRMPSSA